MSSVCFWTFQEWCAVGRLFHTRGPSILQNCGRYCVLDVDDEATVSLRRNKHFVVMSVVFVFPYSVSWGLTLPTDTDVIVLIRWWMNFVSMTPLVDLVVVGLYLWWWTDFVVNVPCADGIIRSSPEAAHHMPSLMYVAVFNDTISTDPVC